MNFAIAPTPPLLATATPATSAEHRKLTDAAQQFEGMLLQEMLKPMKQHGFCQGDDQDDDQARDAGSGFGDTLSSFGTEAMATAIAKGGGLGIAKRVVAQVEGEKASHHSSGETNSPANPK
jgi:flagellar protein FlgJ